MYTQKVGELDIISFFNYVDIEYLLFTKHKPEGYRMFHYLAKKTFKPFMKEFLEADNRRVYIVGIDESVKSGYSHVAVLTHHMRSRYAKVLHSALMAQNSLKYSGKSLEFRLTHPRAFRYKGEVGIDVILVDDIVTTGSTLYEAYTLLTKLGVNVLFALTLAYVKEK